MDVGYIEEPVHNEAGDVGLSYDDDATYEDQVSSANAALSSRISKSKIYLLAESTAPRPAKVR